MRARFLLVGVTNMKAGKQEYTLRYWVETDLMEMIDEKQTNRQTEMRETKIGSETDKKKEKEISPSCRTGRRGEGQDREIIK